MEADLRTRLLADAGVSALVGQRVTWIERPAANALPSITLTLITPGRGYTHEGADGLNGSTVQLDCWAASHVQATGLANAVTAALESPDSEGSTDFSAGFLRAARDFDPEDLAGGVRVYRRALDFELWWRAA